MDTMTLKQIELKLKPVQQSVKGGIVEVKRVTATQTGFSLDVLTADGVDAPPCDFYVMPKGASAPRAIGTLPGMFVARNGAAYVIGSNCIGGCGGMR